MIATGGRLVPVLGTLKSVLRWGEPLMGCLKLLICSISESLPLFRYVLFIPNQLSPFTNFSSSFFFCLLEYSGSIPGFINAKLMFISGFLFKKNSEEGRKVFGNWDFLVWSPLCFFCRVFFFLHFFLN